MNRWLASGLGRLNGLLALLLIFAGLVVGIMSGVRLGPSMGFVMGLIGGFLAVLVCGFLAILIDMKDTMHRIEEQQHIWQAQLAANKETPPDTAHTE